MDANLETILIQVDKFLFFFLLKTFYIILSIVFLFMLDV